MSNQSSSLAALFAGSARKSMHTQKGVNVHVNLSHYNNATRWQYRACVTSRHSGLQRTSVSHHLTGEWFVCGGLAGKWGVRGGWLCVLSLLCFMA